MKTKKAQIGTLQGVIIALLVIGIVLGIGFLVLQEFQETIGTTVGSTANETITMTAAGTQVANNVTADNCFHSFAVTAVNNISDEALTFAVGNYTSEAYSGTIYGTAGSELLGEDVNVSYTYLYDTGEACTGLGATETAIQEIPTWLTIIVIMFIVGILLAIVFRVLPSGGGESSSSFSGSDSGLTAEI